VSPPIRHEAPEKDEELTPMERRAEVTMEETRAGEGFGLGATAQAPEAHLTILGKR
jgi:hypothetical protein